MAEIKSIAEVLSMRLNIPNYQRPYKWSTRNIQTLLYDIEEAINEGAKFGSDYKYRIGTVILHQHGDENNKVYDIVDGQQRLITFTLISKYLDQNNSFSSPILAHEFNHKISQTNIYNNYACIQDWFSQKEEDIKRKFQEAIEKTLEVVIISVNDTSEAFQLFDSQNSRGKALDPHNLLKAYHLREMQSTPYEMKLAVNHWEDQSPEKIKELFADYLFPIWQWSHLQKTRDFTDKEIDIYKGVDEYSPYTFAKRINKARPYFQIPQPFVAGHDFFEMVNHYLHLLETIRIEIATNTQLQEVHRIVNIPKKKKDYEHLDGKYRDFYDCARHNTGMSYARDLFECALLCYYDKFHNFDVMAIKKLCMWAFKIRVVREFLGFDSINKYAIGEGNDSDNISLFAIINMARDHREIAALQIKLPTDISGNSNQDLRRKIITLLKDL